jgi:hypothetical protein
MLIWQALEVPRWPIVVAARTFANTCTALGLIEALQFAPDPDRVPLDNKADSLIGADADILHGGFTDRRCPTAPRSCKQKPKTEHDGRHEAKTSNDGNSGECLTTKRAHEPKGRAASSASDPARLAETGPFLRLGSRLRTFDFPAVFPSAARPPQRDGPGAGAAPESPGHA